MSYIHTIVYIHIDVGVSGKTAIPVLVCILLHEIFVLVYPLGLYLSSPSLRL